MLAWLNSNDTVGIFVSILIRERCPTSGRGAKVVSSQRHPAQPHHYGRDRLRAGEKLTEKVDLQFTCCKANREEMDETSWMRREVR